MSGNVRCAAGLGLGREDGFGEAVGRAFGVQSTAVRQLEVLSDRALFALWVDHETHARRRELGVKPESDGRVLAMWEWPEAKATAPASPLRVEAIMVHAERWRSGLERARRWGAFAPAGVVVSALEPTVVEECALECQLYDVGLVVSDGQIVEVERHVPLPPVRRSQGVRRTADRWLEEALYQQLLQQGHLA